MKHIRIDQNNIVQEIFPDFFPEFDRFISEVFHKDFIEALITVTDDTEIKPGDTFCDGIWLNTNKLSQTESETISIPESEI